MGGGPTAQHVCRAHVRLDTHANTQTHAHVRIHTHVAIPCVLVVPGAACRPCHRHSSWSLPFVLVTTIRPCHCHSSILRCTHRRVQRCHAAMLALRGRMLDRRSCACTPHLAVCMELHLYSTHDRRVETAWLRPQASHQAPRPHLRPCAALRSHLLPFHRQVNQQEGKKSECVQGLFFLSGFAPLAGHAATPQSHHAGAGGPRRGCTAARSCGWGNPRHCHRCPPPTQYGPAGHGWAASRGHAVKASTSPT